MARDKSERPRLSDSIPPSLKWLSGAFLSAVALGLSAKLTDVLTDRATEFPSLSEPDLRVLVGIDPAAKALCEKGKDRSSGGLEASRSEVQKWAQEERADTISGLGLVDQSSHFCRGERPEEDDYANELTVSRTAFSAGLFSPTWHLVNTVAVEGGFVRVDFEANPYPDWLHVAPYTHSVTFRPGTGSFASTADSSGATPPVSGAQK